MLVYIEMQMSKVNPENGSEVSKANLNAYKRILNWRPFMKVVYYKESYTMNMKMVQNAQFFLWL